MLLYQLSQFLASDLTAAIDSLDFHPLHFWADAKFDVSRWGGHDELKMLVITLNPHWGGYLLLKYYGACPLTRITDTPSTISRYICCRLLFAFSCSAKAPRRAVNFGVDVFADNLRSMKERIEHRGLSASSCFLTATSSSKRWNKKCSNRDSE